MRRLWSLGLGLVLAAGSAGAQSVTVGNGTVGGCYPFGCAASPIEYEQIFSSSFTATPLLVNNIAFKLSPDSPIGATLSPASYAIYFSTTATAVDGITTDLAANVTGPESLFGTFTATDSPLDSVYTFTGSVPFAYDPSAGNLLMHIFVAPNDAFTQDAAMFSFFGMDTSGNLMSRAYDHTGINHDQLWTDQSGLVTSFNGAPFPVFASSSPEPSSLALLGTGLLGIIPVYRRRLRA